MGVDGMKFETFEKQLRNLRYWFGYRNLINVANDLEAHEGRWGPLYTYQTAP